MSFTDLTGRHTVVVDGLSGTAPTELTAGGFDDGPCINFPGDGKYLRVYDNLDDFLGLDQYCIEFHAKDIPAPLQGILYLSSRALQAYNTSSPGGYVALSGQGSAPWTASATGHTYAFVRSGTTTKVYLDGVLATTTPETNILGVAPLELFVGILREGGYTFKGKLSWVRITRAARYSADYTPAPPTVGAGDPYWADTVFLLYPVPAVSSGYDITGVTKTTVTGTGVITYDGSAPRTISGVLAAPLNSGEVLRVSLDGGVSWAAATVSGLTWSFSDTTTHTSDWTVSAQVINSLGSLGPLKTLAIDYRSWPSIAISSMEKDDGVVGDWATSNGSGPRAVFGGLSRALTPDEVVLVSSDGINWTLATVTGTNWTAVDSQFHTASWSIQAKVANPPAGLESPITSVAVTYVPPQPTVLPQGSYTTLLDIIRRFMERTGLPKPAFSIGNTDVQVAQILGLLEEATEEIVMRNPRGWQILNRQAIFQTKAQEVQGSLSELAPGFRAVINDTLFNRTTRLPIYGPLLPMERQATKALQTAGPYYRYWIVNDELHFYPIPPAGQTIAFEYTSTAAWSDGKSPPTYTEYPDSDTAICLFPKPVMIAQLRWRWKKEKGLDYAEDFAMAERLLNDAITADGTRRVVDLGGAELVARPGIMIPTGSWPLK